MPLASRSSHRDPNRAPTVVAPMLPDTPAEEKPSVPETPVHVSKAGSEGHSGPALGIATRNVRCLTTLSREVGLIPHLGPAHHVYVCYLKSQITSNNPPSECNLELFGRVRQISCKTPQRHVSWKFPYRCDTRMRVASLIMPQDHLRIRHCYDTHF